MLVILSVVLFLISQWTFRDTLEDDAYISFRYSRNWLEGHGLVYNPGERVEGYTNFLWVVLLAFFRLLGIDFEMSAMVGGALLGTLIIIYLSTTSLQPTDCDNRTQSGQWKSNSRITAPGAATALLLATNPSFQAEAAMGLETMLFCLLTTLGIWTAVREISRLKMSILPSIWIGLALWTRPEGILIGAMILLIQGATTWKYPRLRRQFAASVSVFLLALSLIEGFRLWYYTGWVPNTFLAKTGAGINQLLRGWWYSVDFVRHFGFIPLALVLISPILFVRRSRTFFIPYLWIMIHLIYVTVIGGDYKPTHRFFIVILPTMYLLLCETMGVFIRFFSGKCRRFSNSAAGISGSALLILYIIIALPRYEGTLDFMKSVRSKIIIDRACAAWLRAHATPGETLATEVAGRIPYYTGLITYDMSGLNDRHIARNAIPFDGMLPTGHDRTDAPYIVSRQPDYILFQSILVTAHPDPYLRGRQVNYFESELWKVPDFHRYYTLRSSRLDQGGYFNFYQRRKTPDNPSGRTDSDYDIGLHD